MVQAGLNFSVVIAQGGSAYAWGSNDYGQLGVSDYSARYEPTRVCFPEGECISQIAVGSLHCLAYSPGEGRIYVWGWCVQPIAQVCRVTVSRRNEYAQLGLDQASEPGRIWLNDEEYTIRRGMHGELKWVMVLIAEAAALLVVFKPEQCVAGLSRISINPHINSRSPLVGTIGWLPR